MRSTSAAASPKRRPASCRKTRGFRRSLREAAEQGLPIYAECGGFIYLGESLTIGDARYPMVGALPISFGMEKRPQGHGYTVLEVDGENPFYPGRDAVEGARVPLLPDRLADGGR